MKVMRYSDIFAYIQSFYTGICNTPVLKKIIMQHIEEKHPDFISRRKSADEYVVEMSDLEIFYIMRETAGWLTQRYTSADSAYTAILIKTNFSRSVDYDDFMAKLHNSKITKNEMFYCEYVSEKGITKRCYVENSALKRFIAVEYADAYKRSYVPYVAIEGDDGNGITFYPELTRRFNVYNESEITEFFPNYMEPKKEYNPVPEKIDTLHGLVKTLLKNHEDLIKSESDAARQERIRKSILNLVFVLKGQSEYIKRFFNKDINVLAERYNNGNWMSVQEIQQFFDIQPKSVAVQTYANGIVR